MPTPRNSRRFCASSARDIRVIVFDPKIPEDLYQWDHIHFNVAAHANIAARLAAEIAAEPLARPATPIATHPAALVAFGGIVDRASTFPCALAVDRKLWLPG
jgi:hypothetical protein